MKIVQVLYSGLGGHGAVAFALADSLRSGADSMVFFGIEPVPGAYQARAEALEVNWQEVRTQQGRAWWSWPSLYRALARLKPDAIILHSVKAILPCALYSRRHGVPVVAVEHQANVLKTPAEWRVSRWLQELANCIVVLTPAYRAELEANLGLAWRGDKVCVIPNGIDTDAFSPRHRRDAGPRPFTLGMAARITAIKRHDLLIDAIALLCERDGEDAWRLTLAGSGDELPELRRRVRKRGLGNVVRLPGFLGEAELRHWFGGLDAYVHASDGETLSTSMLQAMAMELPIIGSDVPGIRELLAKGEGSGILVDQSPQAFATALDRLRKDPAEASNIALRAREVACAEFSMKTMAESYRRLLQELRDPDSGPAQ